MATDLRERSRREGAEPQPASPRWRRPALRLLVVVLAAGLGAVLLFGVALLATPSARSAPERVARILGEHAAPSDGGVIPSKVSAALLATEDSRYWSGSALDPQGTLRAVWGLVTANPDEGGATIEVQLAKMLYTPRRSDPAALAEQVVLAFKLDHDFSKRRILAMYLDAAYFGDGAYGVTEASEHYFGRAADELTWGQAALLAGLVQAPTSYDPHGHLGAALRRRAHVLARLVATGTLTKKQADEAAAAPLDPAVTFSG